MFSRVAAAWNTDFQMERNAHSGITDNRTHIGEASSWAKVRQKRKDALASVYEATKRNHGARYVNKKHENHSQVRGAGLSLLRWFLWCRHKQVSWPQTRDGRCYLVCLKCGSEFEYDWERMEVKGERI